MKTVDVQIIIFLGLFFLSFFRYLIKQITFFDVMFTPSDPGTRTPKPTDRF